MIDHTLPEQMTSKMRETIWNTITSHGSENLEYWIETLYNDIRFAAVPFASGADEARKDADLYGVGFVVDGVRIDPARVKVFRGASVPPLSDTDILALKKGINFTTTERRQWYEDSYEATVDQSCEIIKFARLVLTAQEAKEKNHDAN